MRSRPPPALPAALLALLPALLASPARAQEQAPAFSREPAAVLDPATFSHAAPVRATPSFDGVSRLRLPPAVLAVAQPGLADLRVVDAASRQWPFVVVPDTSRDVLDLQLSAVPVPRPSARGEPGRSRWRLVPPVAPVEIDALTLHVDRDTFDRAYRLAGELDAPHRPHDPTPTTLLATGRLTRGAADPADVTLTLPRTRVAALVLTVDDGDEAPLPLTAARAASPVADLLLVAPAGEYTLLAGDPAARPPRYEITQARDRVIAARTGKADLGVLGRNPRHVPAHGEEGSPVERVALWVVLGLAVVALGALTLRLSRREGGAGVPPPA